MEVLVIVPGFLEVITTPVVVWDHFMEIIVKKVSSQTSADVSRYDTDLRPGALLLIWFNVSSSMEK